MGRARAPRIGLPKGCPRFGSVVKPKTCVLVGNRSGEHAKEDVR